MNTVQVPDARNVAAAVDRYMAKPYRIELIPDPDDGGFVVAIPDLPGCLSQGDTVEEALEMIRDAQRSWLTVSIEQGHAIPEPRPIGLGAIKEEYGGKFNVRVPISLHRALAAAAAAEGASLNLFVATALARAVGQADPEARQPGRPRRSAQS